MPGADLFRMLQAAADLLTFAVGVPALVGLLCRLSVLSWRANTASVVGMHLGLTLGVLAALNAARIGQSGPGSLGVVIGSACWLWLSFSTWRFRPPAHTETKQ